SLPAARSLLLDPGNSGRWTNAEARRSERISHAATTECAGPPWLPRDHGSGGDSGTTAGMVSADALAGSDSPRSWRGVLDAYAEPRLGRSVLDLATSVVPYLALLVGMFFA